MAVISKETWDKFTEEEKQAICKDYQDLLNGCGMENFTHEERNGAIFQMEWLIDKENLQPEPKIKTWDDIDQNFEDSTYIKTSSDGMINEDYWITLSDDFESKIIGKVIATLKISKLIELGYGGIITDEEWRNEDINKFSIVCEGNKLSIDCLPEERHFISFHSVQQAEEFMSYPENLELIKQYHMV